MADAVEACVGHYVAAGVVDIVVVGVVVILMGVVFGAPVEVSSGAAPCKHAEAGLKLSCIILIYKHKSKQSRCTKFYSIKMGLTMHFREIEFSSCHFVQNGVAVDRLQSPSTEQMECALWLIPMISRLRADYINQDRRCREDICLANLINSYHKIIGIVLVCHGTIHPLFNSSKGLQPLFH